MRGICKDSKVRNESEKFGRDRAKSLSHYTVSSGLVRSLPNRPEVESPRRQSELSRRIPNPRKISMKNYFFDLKLSCDETISFIIKYRLHMIL